MAAVLKIGFWPNCAASSFVLCTRDRVNNGQIAKKVLSSKNQMAE